MMRSDNVAQATVEMRYADDEKPYLNILFDDIDQYKIVSACDVTSVTVATNCVLSVMLNSKHVEQILSSARVIIKQHVSLSKTHKVDRFIDKLEEVLYEDTRNSMA